eukprot:scaffold260185_cov31-Attheya_sp.AAC.1
MTDVDSVKSHSPPVPTIILTSNQENFGIDPLGQITQEDRDTFSAFKTKIPDHGYDTIEDLHNAIKPLHLKYFHSDTIVKKNFKRLSMSFN